MRLLVVPLFCGVRVGALSSAALARSGEERALVSVGVPSEQLRHVAAISAAAASAATGERIIGDLQERARADPRCALTMRLDYSASRRSPQGHPRGRIPRRPL